MTIRVARTTDASGIAQTSNDFWAEVGGETTTQDATSIRVRLADPNLVYVFDTTTHAYCEIKRNPRSRDFQVGLFPRTVSQNILFAVLKACLVETLRRFPDEGDWRIWGWFPGGRNAAGEKDGGEELTLVWQRAFTGARRGFIDGRWVIEWTLRGAAEA